MGKKNKIDYYFGIAVAVSSGTSCQRDMVGAVVVNLGRVISTGYNFHPRNCAMDERCLRSELGVNSDTAVEQGYCIHAEMNALLFGNYSDMIGGSIFVTRPPCPLCAKLIIQAGLHCYFYGAMRKDTRDMIDSLGKLHMFHGGME